MKKILLLLLMLLPLSACDVGNGNRETSIFNKNENNTFDKVHIYGLNKCLPIKTWKLDTQKNYLYVQLKNNTQMNFNIYTTKCILINGKCPICESEQ